MWLEEVCPIQGLKLWTVFVLHDCSLIVPVGAHLDLDCFIVRLLGQEINITVLFANLAGRGSHIAAPAWSHPVAFLCISVYMGMGILLLCHTPRQASLHHYTYGLAVLNCYLPVIVLVSRPQLLPACHCTRQPSSTVTCLSLYSSAVLNCYLPVIVLVSGPQLLPACHCTRQPSSTVTCLSLYSSAVLNCYLPVIVLVSRPQLLPACHCTRQPSSTVTCLSLYSSAVLNCCLPVIVLVSGPQLIAPHALGTLRATSSRRGPLHSAVFAFIHFVIESYHSNSLTFLCPRRSVSCPGGQTCSWPRRRAAAPCLCVHQLVK